MCLDKPGVPGQADPVTGNDLTAEIELTGTTCDASFSCGDANGITIDPSGISLDGSTWTLQRLSAPASYPDPATIDCSGNVAGPPPSDCP